MIIGLNDINWLGLELPRFDGHFSLNDGDNPELTSDEREELRRLRRKNKQLRQEREILSKAAPWFAQNEVTSRRSSNFLYLAVVLDAFSGRIIGWSMGNRQKAQLVIDTTTPCVKASLPRLNANSLIAVRSKPKPKHVSHALNLFKDGIPPHEDIPLWDISRP